MKKLLLIFCAVLTFALAANAATITWTGAAADGLWATAGNWSPSTNAPLANDEVLFNNGATNTVTLPTTGLPAAPAGIGQLKITGMTTVIFKAISGTTTLPIAGLASGDDLIVGAGSTLTIATTSSTASQQIIQISVLTGATGSISGSMNFGNTGSQSIAHRLLAADNRSVTFQSGAIFTADAGQLTNPFSTTPLNVIVFANGSRYISKGGSNPFGATGANTVVVFETGSTYQHDQTTAPAFSGRTYPNFELTKALTASTGASTLTINGNLVIKSGGTAIFNFNAANSILINGNIEVQSGGSLTLGTSAVSSGATNVVFNGTSAAQTITNNGTLLFDTKSKITISNSNGVQINSNVTAKDLDFVTITPGNLTLGSKDLTLTGVVTNAAADRHVVTDGVGKLKMSVGATAVIFPVGISAASYDPATIANSGTADEFSVNVGTTLPYPTNDNTQAVNRVWNINETVAGGSSVILSLTPNDLTTNAAGGTFTAGNMAIGHGNGANYVRIFSTNSGGTTTSTVPITSFSPFIVANDVALGVELRNFYAQLLPNNQVNLTWQTASEKNNQGFEIERSTDANSWTKIGFVRGHGSTNAEQKYNFTDQGPLSINYYRLRQMDFDGNETISKTLSINVKGKWTTKIFPNPVTNHVTIDLGEIDNAAIRLVDVLGKEIVAKQGQSGQSSFDVSLLSAGIYFVEIKVNGKVTREKIVKQ